jgi:hypothetical protein
MAQTMHAHMNKEKKMNLYMLRVRKELDIGKP